MWVAAIAALVLVVVGVVAFSGGDDGNDSGLTVRLTGPTELDIGEQGIWRVESPDAVSGTWSLTGPVQPDADALVWAPGNWFQGTWNVPAEVTLTLTVVDADGNTASGSISFTVG
ncbi:MAG TPA: hypothetical protein DCR14_10520 [Acidimicrobiaceae bacterium]|nr:hypothetical protein [Acidimicrobiaceae bacterium]